jgi:Serine carboxypeptidase S28
MKLVLKLLAFVALLQLSVAVKSLGKNDFWWSKKYREHREPPFDSTTKFSDEEPVEEKWIEQRLNNFDPQDERTWMMRYLENSMYLEDGGPIFINVGGEWTVTAGWLMTGHMHDMARDLNGTMFYTEHRYYGESRPTDDLTVDNLRFLNVDQALADLAHFIVHIKETIPEVRNSGVILVGGSYSATMVTWFMQKYPHLANGAWSSSAPLEAKVDFVEYKEVVTEAIQALGGQNCSRRIESAIQELEKLYEDGNSGRIEELFRLCYQFKPADKLDVWSFFSTVSGPFSGLVQYHREANQDIQGVCSYLENLPIENDLEALAYWLWFGDGEIDPENFEFCYNHHYENEVYFYNGTDWSDLAALFEIRQWYYQTCAEYGWYQSSGSDKIIFGSNFPVNLSLQLCNDLYSGM